VGLRDKPIVPYLMGVGTVSMGLGKMGIDIRSHPGGQFPR
jgi:hypothetical protein